MNGITRLAAPTLFFALAVACGSEDPSSESTPVFGDGGVPMGAGGGFSPTGGASTAGFGPDTGGAPAGSGGVPGGGAPGAGGTIATGGAPSGTGGLPPETGGAPGTGGAPAATCLPTASLVPGETTRTIDVGGTARTYILHVPPGYTGSEPVPLVIDFHPLLSNAGFQRDSSGYRALADQEGFVVAWPDGIDNAWNVGPCCTRSRTVDDVGFARAMVAEIESLGCIDEKRVYAAGFSMGGGMSHYLACHAADVFAAVAPAAFDLLQENEADCVPARPISVMAFRGTADIIVPYAGGASRPPNGLPVTIHFLGAEGTFAKWQTLNGCTGAPVSNGACQTYSQCAEGVEVTLCTAVGGGHATGDARLGWEMMKRHPMP